jgi:7-cyano-7-deazaguanine synthase
MSKKAVLIYSGGMDSYTMLNCLAKANWQLAALSFDYGQRHSKELQFAKRVCENMGIPHHVLDLQVLNPLLQGSSLTSAIDVPEGHYSEETMKATVVPNRNMIMLSIAIGYAVSINHDHVYTAVHAGDHAVYPDCRKVFVDAMSAVGAIANYRPVTVQAPFIDISKGDILKEGAKVGLVAEDYKNAWTCYNGREQACGKCGACVERLEAFSELEWTDPLEYEDREFYKEAIANA